MRECYTQMEPYFEPMGLELVAVEYFDFEAVEFYPLLNELIDLGVDAIIPTSEGAQRGLFVKQARELGYDGLFVDPAPIAASDIIDIAGEEASEGYFTCGAATFGDMATPEANEFYNAYITSYGQWEANVIDVAIFFQVLVNAMQTADSVEVEDVLAVLHTGGPFDSILGPIYIGGLEAYGTNNQVFVPLAVQQIQNGELVNLQLMTAEAQLESFEAVSSPQ
jgi:branched-chain amino acid transport system substrate-binding protein